MKLIHLSDLHLGKRLNEFNLLEDQKYILKEILKIVDTEKPDAVLLAGDIYDKSVPSAEAVELFDDFLAELAGRRQPVFVLSGNHDSPERIAFGGRIMNAGGVYLSPVYDGKVEPVTLTDAHGAVNVYMLPFIKPAHVRRYYEEEEIASYTDAVRIAVDHMNVDPLARNVLVTHQFVTGAERSESEEISVGGTDNVDASVFDVFDYVALGHIHGPQNVEAERVRYCGTPLKYSFSEVKHQKSVTVAELGAKGDLTVRTVPLTPMRDMYDLKGTYEELTALNYYNGQVFRDGYVRITLTDERDVPDAFAKLRLCYPNLMELRYDNARTRCGVQSIGPGDVERKSPIELFRDFYKQRTGGDMSEEQDAYMCALIEKVWGDEQ